MSAAVARSAASNTSDAHAPMTARSKQSDWSDDEDESLFSSAADRNKKSSGVNLVQLQRQKAVRHARSHRMLLKSEDNLNDVFKTTYIPFSVVFSYVRKTSL